MKKVQVGGFEYTVADPVYDHIQMLKKDYGALLEWISVRLDMKDVQQANQYVLDKRDGIADPEKIFKIEDVVQKHTHQSFADPDCRKCGGTGMMLEERDNFCGEGLIGCDCLKDLIDP